MKMDNYGKPYPEYDKVAEPCQPGYELLHNSTEGSCSLVQFTDHNFFWFTSTTTEFQVLETTSLAPNDEHVLLSSGDLIDQFRLS